MDWKLTKKQLRQWWDKYKYAAVILLLGLFLMNVPMGQESREEPMETTDIQEDVAEKLTEILSQIDGVGDVKVMVTEATGAETVYQTDLEETNGSDSASRREKTVLYSVSGGEEGLVRTIRPALYLGAVIVCEGGDKPAVSLAVTEAVSKVLGISSDRIAVLKMK